MQVGGSETDNELFSELINEDCEFSSTGIIDDVADGIHDDKSDWMLWWVEGDGCMLLFSQYSNILTVSESAQM